MLIVAPSPPTSSTCDLVESYAMLTARGQRGALTRLEGDGHGVAVGEAAADGVGVGEAEGVAKADGDGVGVGEAAASG